MHFEIMANSNATAIISVCKFDSEILKTFVVSSNGFLEGVSDGKYLFMRHQDLPAVYIPNGAIYS